MDASSEAAEQIVRMTLEGTEVALRITGAGAKNAAAMLLAAAASNEKTKGRARLSAMLKSGRELRVFPIRFDDLKGFAKEARRYGIAYAVVKQKDGESVDLLVRTEDASKVNRRSCRSWRSTRPLLCWFPPASCLRGQQGTSRRSSRTSSSTWCSAR